MPVKINRRGFLKALAALGAAIVLPPEPTNAEVDAEWSRMLREPWYFDVDEYGTIIESGVDEPQVRADVFEDIYVEGVKTVDELIDQVDSCAPLVSRFQSLAADELEDIQNRLDEDDDIRHELGEEEDLEEQLRLRGDLLPDAERAKLENVAQLLADEDEGWKAWVRLGGKEALPRFTQVVEAWLDEPVAWDEKEWFPDDWCAQGKALRFFQSTAAEVADELGVVIVEGQHPGSSYYAAELRAGLDQANEVAVRMQLPFRFRRHGPS